MTARPILTLTTDFGLADAYVASMKGIVLEIAPDAVLVDITHEVPAQDIARASFILATACPYFPARAVHLVVVDPGVGTKRKPIAVSASHGTFVGPDNGVFHDVLVAQGAIDPVSGALISATAVELVDPHYRRPVVSSTFHGRDIFAPAAAHLALGVPLSELGPAINSLVVDVSSNPYDEDGVVHGRIRYIDRFGNAISTIRRDSLPADPIIVCRGIEIAGLARDYQASEIAALLGSNGHLEIAVRNGSAHERLHINVGDEVLVRKGR